MWNTGDSPKNLLTYILAQEHVDLPNSTKWRQHVQWTYILSFNQRNFDGYESSYIWKVQRNFIYSEYVQ